MGKTANPTPTTPNTENAMTRTEIAALLNRVIAAESATSQAEEKCENAAHALHLAKAELAKNRRELVALSGALSAAWAAAS